MIPLPQKLILKLEGKLEAVKRLIFQIRTMECRFIKRTCPARETVVYWKTVELMPALMVFVIKCPWEGHFLYVPHLHCSLSRLQSADPPPFKKTKKTRVEC